MNLIKYYIDEKNNNQYLMSIDDDYGVIIWDISKNFNIYSKQRILLYASSFSSHIKNKIILYQVYFPRNKTL